MNVDLTEGEANVVVAGLALLAEVVHDPEIAQHLTVHGHIAMSNFLKGVDRRKVFWDVTNLANRMITCRDTA